tara:strand:- start:21751 stop:22362 length:612 start_codon:yes stop_codon:yes gene_type:complete
MVNQKINAENKKEGIKKIIKTLIIIFVGILILIIVSAAGFILKKSEKVEVVIENPLKDIVSLNTNVIGEVNVEAVVEQAVLDFDAEYINYLLISMGTGYLHNSLLFGNPLIEFVLEGETWNSEIKDGVPNSQKGGIDNEDLRITLSKEEAIRGLLSQDIEQFMKNSVNNGNVQIEMIANNVELFSKGYLTMYKELTGEEISVE